MPPSSQLSSLSQESSEWRILFTIYEDGRWYQCLVTRSPPAPLVCWRVKHESKLSVLEPTVFWASNEVDVGVVLLVLILADDVGEASSRHRRTRGQGGLQGYLGDR